jgi:dTMP kinase
MLIVLEGVDGAGKATQLALVSERLREEGLAIERVSFPRYQEGVFAASVARFLNGGFGDPGTLPPHFPALLFACDRLEHRRELLDALDRSDLVLADRYVASNAAYQGARLDAPERDAFLEWLLDVEYGVFELPRPALQVHLRVDVATARGLVAGKPERGYTTRKHDVLEDDDALQRAVARLYEEFAARSFGGPWSVVEVCDEAGRPRAPEGIADSLCGIVLELVRNAPPGGRRRRSGPFRV